MDEDEIEDTQDEVASTSNFIAVNPSRRDAGLILEPKETDYSKYAIPAAIGIVGVAALYFYLNREDSDSSSKKKKKNGKVKTKKAESDEVIFYDNFKKYDIGSDWFDEKLEPFLSEQAEENNLITDSHLESLFIKDSDMGSKKKSRDKIIKTFISTYKVRDADDDHMIIISKLPENKAKEDFLSYIEEMTEEFQSEY